MNELNIVQRRITVENPEDLELVLDCINLHTVYTLVLDDGKFIFTTMSMDDSQLSRITNLMDTFGIEYKTEDIAWEEVVRAVEELDISDEEIDDEEVVETLVVDGEDA